MIETGAHRKPLSREEQQRLLDRLIDVFGFERFIEKAYLGQKMFSIEGLDAIVPMIDELFDPRHARAAPRRSCSAWPTAAGSASSPTTSAARRSRSSPSSRAPRRSRTSRPSPRSRTAAPATSSTTTATRASSTTPDGEEIDVRLYPNPSHLEFVDPVVTGAARAAQTDLDGPKLDHDPSTAVPVLLHGDAAFPGQGVVAETFNLQSLDGYSTGGTIHIIQNNQIGFTTDPNEGRSTPYAADMAKGFNVPIIHVNADDVEACVAAMRLAMAYRERWGRDVVIDLIGYRRYGHNETDEPAYTQPLMAAKIKEHPPVSQIYAETAGRAEGVVSREDVEKRAEERRERCSKRRSRSCARRWRRGEYEDPTATTGTGELDRSASPQVETAVDDDRLRKLNEELIRVPDSFTIHRKLRKPLAQAASRRWTRAASSSATPRPWPSRSLLTEGVHVRMTGQDTERGTFSHRHLVLHDEKTGLEYAPIQNLDDAKAPFELHNSPLSETACLGFEYGYSAASPDSLVLWEAQFGDFGNSAQVIIDSFIVSARRSGARSTRLTLLLPHGYEGAGPEHSSARIERFLQLAAEGNIRIANPTTAAQYFHLLRRQAQITKARPLVVFTPKGLLRLAARDLDARGPDRRALPVRPRRPEGRRPPRRRSSGWCSAAARSTTTSTPPSAARRRERRRRPGRAALPVRQDQLTELIAAYPNLKEIVWVQEEPRNMGAWSVMQRRLPDLLPEGVELGYVGRPAARQPRRGLRGRATPASRSASCSPRSWARPTRPRSGGRVRAAGLAAEDDHRDSGRSCADRAPIASPPACGESGFGRAMTWTKIAARPDRRRHRVRPIPARGAARR